MLHKPLPKKKVKKTKLSKDDQRRIKEEKEKLKATQAAKLATRAGQKKAEEEKKAKLALTMRTLVGPTHVNRNKDLY
jgi:hypothetical protein